MEFKEFPKIPRLSREMTISEKIDGTNGLICITEAGEFLVGSRTRWITPADDNYGFAAWAEANKAELMKLGVGFHYGEWWGGGIQRGYGLDKKDKRFSLFNTARWNNENAPACCSVVPVLYTGIFDTDKILDALTMLKNNGSLAARGFMNPEGVVIYHSAAKHYFKKTILKDEEYKGRQ